MNLKKPKFWDYKKPNIFAYLLIPIAIFFQLKKLFKFKSKFKNPKIKTICVGNIYVGGTGKTSLCIKINEILKKNKIKSCFVKKFYENQFDEQELLASRGKLFKSSKRYDSLNDAITGNYEVAIFDDGLQDSSINYDLKILCFNNINWIGNGLSMPAGPLRENISNLKNYQHVFLNGNDENTENIKKYILNVNSNINIYIAKYRPLNLGEFDKNDKYLVFSGIGNHLTFLNMIKNYGLNVFKDLEFPDHYHYKDDDINSILNLSETMGYKIITTEKDYLRIKKRSKSNKINFIKSDLNIINEEKFINLITKKNETN